MRIYAIGDIHGHVDKLCQVHDWIAQDKMRTGDVNAPIVHLGDYVDRGPDTRGMLDLLAQAFISSSRSTSQPI